MTIKSNSPPVLRLAMGYCYFYLNSDKLAQLCFLRVLDMNKNVVEAYIGLASI